MLIFTLSIICPLYYCLIYSLSDGNAVINARMTFLPIDFTWDNYRIVFKNPDIFKAFAVSTSRTVIHTSLSVLLMAAMGYGMSRKKLMGRKIYFTLGIITMYFNGGLIPYFILLKKLQLIDNFLVYVIPGLISFFNVLIFISFFRDLPEEIEESAKIDGANDITIFFRIILPVSLPPIATIVLFVGVANWNDFFTGVLFMIRRMDLLPIQTVLYRIIVQNDTSAFGNSFSQLGMQYAKTSAKSIQLATMFITILPIIGIYPFLQRYLVKGLMVGAIKG
jgi:putative aldouronate transport system permease protein